LADTIEHVHVNSETSESVIESVIATLGRHFEKYSTADKKFKDYVNSHFDKMARDRSINNRSILADFDERTLGENNEEELARHRILVTVDVSLYFCFLANEAFVARKSDEAWFFATEASKWCGIATGTAFAFHVLLNSARTHAASGGRGRSDSYEPLRQFALEAVKKRIYPSRRNAALRIKPEVLKLAAELRIPLSEQQAERTITGWLQDVPFASTRGT